MGKILHKDRYGLGFGLLAFCLAWTGAAAATSDPPSSVPPPSLALVIGMNRGGPGQTDLQFAEDDARHVADLLGSLGRHRPGKVELLLRPAPGDVQRALDNLVLRATEARRLGAEAQVLFYYSGHAASLAGELLVRLEPAGTVFAEMHKAEGQEVLLALPPGRYAAIYRQAGHNHRVRHCDVALADGHTEILNANSCVDVAPLAVAAKGIGYSPRERWTFHAALGASSVRNDRFIGRLTDFGFEDSLYFGVPRFSLDAMRVVGRHLALGIELASLDERVFRRQSSTTLSGQDERYWWATYELGAFLLVDYSLWRDRLVPYARAGVGLTLARTSYQEIDDNTHVVKSDDGTTDFGYALRAGAGLGVMPWRHVGFFVEANATYAPTVDNLLGDVHDSGGLGLLLGLRGAL
jgi:hypothetical protein